MRARWNLATNRSSIVELAGVEAIGDLLEIGADRERRFLPEHQALEVALGEGDRFEQAVEHLAADGVHLRFEGDDGDVGIERRSRIHRRTPSFSQTVPCRARSDVSPSTRSGKSWRA